MKSALIGLVVIIVIAVAGFYAWRIFGPTPTLAPVVVADTQSTYTTSTYSVKYPSDFVLNAQYAYDLFGPNKLINGVKVTIPSAMATGTNLSADTYLSIEQLPRAKKCTGDIYLTASVVARTITEGGVDYSFASSTGAAAGNRYEEQVYALATSSPCTAVRYYIHSSGIENFVEGAVQEFDKEALLTSFDKIRQSLVLQ